jgi:hypothetical protein
MKRPSSTFLPCLSQVTSAPETVAARFDRALTTRVAERLRAGCTHMHTAFDFEDINFDELISTAMEDPQAIAAESKAFRPLAEHVQKAFIRGRRQGVSTSRRAWMNAGSSARLLFCFPFFKKALTSVHRPPLRYCSIPAL